MTKLPLLSSRYRFTYLSIFLIFGLLSFGCLGVSRFIVAPLLKEKELISVRTLIDSHDLDIMQNNIRSLRDELIRSRVIASDRDFDHYLPGDKEGKARIEKILKNCQHSDARTCITRAEAIFFGSNRKYSIVLLGDFLKTPATLIAWELLTIFLVALSFLALYLQLLNEENFFSSRMKNSMEKIKELVEELDGDVYQDEFKQINDSFEVASSQIRAFREKFQRKTRLEQLGITMGQVSHDLKAPMNEAQNFIESLPALLKHNSVEEVFTISKSVVDRLKQGKENLSLAMKQTKKSVTANQIVSIDILIRALHHRALNDSHLCKLKFKIDMAPTLIMADEKLLSIALWNLLENAADQRVDAQIFIQAKEIGEKLFIKICDNGGGFDSSDTSFEAMKTSKVNGHGFGLVRTKEIIEVHGGSIYANSTPNGAEFIITLPRILEAAHA